MSRHLLAVVLVAACLSACNCQNSPPSTVDSGEGGGGEGGGTGGGTGGGVGGGGGGDVDGGLGDGGIVDPNDPNNANKDADCDGLSDAEEFSGVYGGGKRTDPANPDSDGDGLKDGVELGRQTSVDAACGFVGDADANTRTVPTEADTDGDGLPDGVEDANRDGKGDTGETDPLNPDTDADGLKDGDEDANHNGAVDANETDPRIKDTDQDGINDGIERTVTLTNPAKADTDGDTCPDGAEDSNQNGVVDPGETNPKDPSDCGGSVNKDTDQDGIFDRIEDANGNGTYDPPTETNFNAADTDGDGLSDGVEDANKNGLADIGETDPRRKDSDCDGLIDGPTTVQGVKGEDQDSNGQVNGLESDPRKYDTDGDGISDGVEVGLTANPDPTNCPNVVIDLDPNTTTDPTKRDSDGDGIDDGAEDTNQNGRVDPGELDPRNGSDGQLPDGGTTPAGHVCTAANLRPVVFKAEGGPDLRLGLPDTFTELSTMTVGGTAKGLIGYDATSKVAFVAWRQTAPSGATTPSADEAAIRPTLNGIGAISNPTTQTFTTWDGVAALQAFYDQAGAADVKTRANDIANQLVGNGAGALNGLGGATGPFRLQVEYAHRSNQSVVVLVALTPAASYVEPGIFSVSDTAGGSALAQFGDANAVQCETFQPANSKVDFLFVVDDSCSMASYQTALANSASAMATKLNNSSLDWRIGMVTTAYYRNTTSGNENRLRGFTTDINQFRSWLTQSSTCQAGTCNNVTPAPACDPAGGANGGCWIGTGGSGTESSLHSAARAVDVITPAPAVGQPDSRQLLRNGATLLVVLLGDADDQSAGTAAGFTTFFQTPNGTITIGTGTFRNESGQSVSVHGIVCPSGQACGETQANPRKNLAVVTSTGGVLGDINTAASITATINQIVDSAIAAAGHRMLKPPIGASVKVALDEVQNPTSCPSISNVPRSRVNGFDFDGVNRSISFFGACRPGAGARAAAVSYRYWIDTTPNPNGNPPPCSSDPFYDPTDSDFCRGRLACDLTTNICVCPTNCGGTPPAGKVCNPNRLVCDFVCTFDCGGTCGGYQSCDTTSCTCQCLQNATCAPGYKFVNTGGVCGCVCDTAALNCGATYEPDATSCSCKCKAACGGCPTGQTCNMSTCGCNGDIG